MKIKFSTLIFLGTIGISTLDAQAQNYEDVLRYSSLTTGTTTARALSIGGAGGSLGADFSASSINPAGLGVYRQSELTITPYLNFNTATTNYINNTVDETNTAFKFGNVGLVLNSNGNNKNSGWKGVKFAIGFNKLADFNTNTTYSGINNVSSFSEKMASDAQTLGVNETNSPFSYLGYEAYILDNNLKSIPYNNVIARGGSLRQTKYNESKGAVNEYTLSLAGNYDDKLMIGGTLGITSYRFKRITDFVENDNTGIYGNDFNNFSFREDLQTTGVGVNGKFGAIFAPVQSFRLGLSVHTPTFAKLTDIVDYNVRSDMEGLGTYIKAPQNLYRSDYTITTPMRAIVSATGFIGNKAFVTADYEYVPYQSMRLKYEGNNYNDEERYQNDLIRQIYKAGSNLRIGAEVRATREFSLRAGLAYYGNPYKKDYEALGGDRLDISFGMGYKLGSNSFIDLTYMHSQNSYEELPYSVSGVTPISASITNKRNVFALTYGVKF